LSVIYSRLAKSAAFIESSAFPPMVQAAAGEIGVPYDTYLLAKVAADPAVTGGVVLPVEEGMDAVLKQMTTDEADAARLDALITDAVRRHTEGA